MRILIATDAWHPQVNGVVRALETMAAEAEHDFSVEIGFLTPLAFRSFPMPTYPEIRLALATAGAVGRHIEKAHVDHIHIATEGPIGMATRRYCLRSGQLFTTSYHTRFPEYVWARTRIPEDWSYAWLRRFHNAGIGMMVSTSSLASELAGRGFNHPMLWTRGVDHSRFKPGATPILDLPRPIFLYAGRVAIEKNIDAFLRLDLPGSKVIVGDGPERALLQSRYPQAHFLGMKDTETLARLYASADVCVFPSRTDTFGMVMIEAMACGVPVAAYPVPGPIDVVGDSGAGALDVDLRAACLRALNIPREAAIAQAGKFTWSESARQFIDNVLMARAAHGALAAVEQTGTSVARNGRLTRAVNAALRKAKAVPAPR